MPYPRRRAVLEHGCLTLSEPPPIAAAFPIGTGSRFRGPRERPLWGVRRGRRREVWLGYARREGRLVLRVPSQAVALLQQTVSFCSSSLRTKLLEARVFRRVWGSGAIYLYVGCVEVPRGCRGSGAFG